jgi:hypothetical protein
MTTGGRMMRAGTAPARPDTSARPRIGGRLTLLGVERDRPAGQAADQIDSHPGDDTQHPR